MFGSYFRTLAAILVSDFVLVSAATKTKQKPCCAPRAKGEKREKKKKRLSRGKGRGGHGGKGGKGGGSGRGGQNEGPGLTGIKDFRLMAIPRHTRSESALKGEYRNTHMAVFWGVAFEVGTQSFLVRRETSIGRLLALLGPKTHSGSVKNTPKVDTTNSIRCRFCPPTPDSDKLCMCFGLFECLFNYLRNEEEDR